MRASIPIGIQPGTRLLRIERVPGERVAKCASCQQWTDAYGSDPESAYLIWIHHNPDFTLGTYLTLYSDGRITNTTVKEDGTEDVFQVKPPDD